MPDPRISEDAVLLISRLVNEAEDMKDIGKEALNDDKFVKRIRDGNGFNVNTLQKVIDWIDAQGMTAPAMERAS